jgi:hypothetical protein
MLRRMVNGGLERDLSCVLDIALALWVHGYCFTLRGVQAAVIGFNITWYMYLMSVS